MAFNPLNSNSEDTSFETGNPLTQAAKNIAKAASTQTQAQIKASNKAIVAQLYGVTPTEQEQATDNANPLASAQTNQPNTQGQQQVGNSNTSKSPEENATMEKIRRELFGNYASKFKSASNAQPGMITTDVEQEMEKARQERKQKEAQWKQQEEEESRQREEAEQEKKKDVMPSGKKTGMMYGRKQQQPIELERAKTRTEVNRGTTG